MRVGFTVSGQRLCECVARMVVSHTVNSPHQHVLLRGVPATLDVLWFSVIV